MAASCQNNTVTLSPTPKPTLEQRLLGTWKWVEYVDGENYFSPSGIKASPADHLLTYSFEKNARFITTEYAETKIGTYQADTTIRTSNNDAPKNGGQLNLKFGDSVIPMFFNVNASGDTLRILNEFSRKVFVKIPWVIDNNICPFSAQGNSYRLADIRTRPGDDGSLAD